MDSCSHHVAGFFLVTIVSLFLFGCGRTEGTVPVVPCAGLDAREQASFDQFCRDVVPILESRCAANCHGVSSKQVVEFTSSRDHAGFFYFPINPVT